MQQQYSEHSLNRVGPSDGKSTFHVLSRSVGLMLKSLLAAALAAIITAIPAHGDDWDYWDDPEGAYLSVLAENGITHPSDSQSLASGYYVCENIARGMMPRAVENDVAKNAPKLSGYQAEVIVATAVAWLCPEYGSWYIDNRPPD